MEAQREFLQVSMKELKASGNFTCPPKYLDQRDAALEIPMECVRRLCDAVDTDFDDRVSEQELAAYIEKHQLPFEADVPSKLYNEALTGRGWATEKQRTAPLSHEEVASTLRGRHKWSTATKEWEIHYRPYRNHWIVLLLTVNKRIFAMPMPRVIPTKIVAQYQQEEERQWAQTQGRPYDAAASMGVSAGLYGSLGTSARTGIDARYSKISGIKEPVYQRDLTKNEAGIMPDRGSTIKIAPKKSKQKGEENAYEKQVNSRMKPDADAGGFPKVTFAAQQMFNEADNLSKKVPTWTTQAENPINVFVPDAEQSYKSATEAVLREHARRTDRSIKLSTLAGKERTLQLAGTMALKTRKCSPLSKLRETRGMVTVKRVPDIHEQKNSLCQVEEKKTTYEFAQKGDHQFKTYDTLAFMQKDFSLNANVPDFENKHGMTGFEQNKKPKEYWDRVLKHEAEAAEAAAKAGKAAWVKSHVLPLTHVPISQSLADHHATKKQGGKPEATQTLEKEKWESAYILLARTVKDDLVVGKEPFQIYLPVMRPQDKEKTFTGTAQAFKQIV